MPVPLPVGIPRGMVTGRDRVGRTLANDEASNLLNSWHEAGELRVRYGMSDYRGKPATATGPVQNLFLAEFGDGSRSILRFDEDAVYNDTGSAWSEIVPGAPPFWTGVSTAPFGVATVLNQVIAANGVAADGVKRWPGTGDFATIAPNGILNTHNSFRYVTGFASRVIGAYTTASNGANTIVGSALLSVTDWTVRNGAFESIRTENSSPISGLTSDSNSIICWKERAIIIGTATGDDSLPIFWKLLQTQGIGSVSNRLIVNFGGAYLALSHEGFIQLSGDQIRFVDQDIKRDFFRRLNYSALRQAHAVMLEEQAKTIFFIPEGTDPYPKNAWIYDWISGGWDRWQLGAAISASARVYASVGAVIDAYGGEGAIADITGGNALIDTGLISDYYIDSIGTEPSAAVYVFGDSSGNTYFFDENSTLDGAVGFPFFWETGDYRWEGLVDPETGDPFGPHELVTLDQITFEYNSSTTTVVQCSISVDGGESWTSLGSVQLTPTSSKYSQLDFWTRAQEGCTGTQVRIRMEATFAAPGLSFRDLIVYGLRAGERR